MDRLLCSAQTGDNKKDYKKNRTRLRKGEAVDIEYAEYIERYKLQLRFSDDTEKVVDFGNFLTRSLNPLIRKYLDVEKFRNFTVEYGDLFWNDYDLCFPVADLYEGRI
jgi:hypothetical protein